MRYEDVTVGEPGPGQIRVRQSAIGVNFIDIYFRSGLYKAPQLPFTPATRAPAPWCRWARASPDSSPGERGRLRLGLRHLCEEVGDRREIRRARARGHRRRHRRRDDAEGPHTQYLLRRTYRVQPGDTILFHAAAGGVGLIATQWASTSAPR